jgi:ribosomal silencing factor RsfS
VLLAVTRNVCQVVSTCGCYNYNVELTGVHVGARAIKFMLKEARAKAGSARPVGLYHDRSTPWFSVACGAVSVHCMSADVRAELELEALAAAPGDVVWWQRSEQRLTVHNIGAEAAGAWGAEQGA